MFEGGPNLSLQVAEEVSTYFPDKVYAPYCPERPPLPGPSHETSGLRPQLRGAESYAALAAGVF